MLTKEKFCEAIEAVQNQYDFETQLELTFDKYRPRADFGEPLFINDNLIKIIIQLLADNIGVSSYLIETWMWETCFGRYHANNLDGKDLIYIAKNAAELYDVLIRLKDKK